MFSKREHFSVGILSMRRGASQLTRQLATYLADLGVEEIHEAERKGKSGQRVTELGGQVVWSHALSRSDLTVGGRVAADVGDGVPAGSGALECGPPQAGEVMADGPSVCPRCGGDLDYDRQIEKAVRYKDDVALVTVRADVCTQCGERLFRPEMVEVMEQARDALKWSRVAPVVGNVYDYRSMKAS